MRTDILNNEQKGLRETHANPKGFIIICNNILFAKGFIFISLNEGFHKECENMDLQKCMDLNAYAHQSHIDSFCLNGFMD